MALVGPSGAGKTTIINLLMKLYTPAEGAIFLDGQDLREIDTNSLRNAISIVSQDTFLFNETIEHNIKYGNPGASHADVVAAAKQAHIHDYVLGLPDGYATLIGERGSKLSVGQRQRISLARAFLKNAPVLVLDEPTSSLDTMTEALFRDSLRALARDRTTLVISHRMFVCDMATTDTGHPRRAGGRVGHALGTAGEARVLLRAILRRRAEKSPGAHSRGPGTDDGLITAAQASLFDKRFF